MSKSNNVWLYVALYSGNGLYAHILYRGQEFKVRLETLSNGKSKRYNFDNKHDALEFAATATN